MKPFARMILVTSFALAAGCILPIPLLQNQWEGKSNEEFIDGGAGNGRSAPCGGKLKE